MHSIYAPMLTPSFEYLVSWCLGRYLLPVIVLGASSWGPRGLWRGALSPLVALGCFPPQKPLRLGTRGFVAGLWVVLVTGWSSVLGCDCSCSPWSPNLHLQLGRYHNGSLIKDCLFKTRTCTCIIQQTLHMYQ